MLKDKYGKIVRKCLSLAKLEAAIKERKVGFIGDHTFLKLDLSRLNYTDRLTFSVCSITESRFNDAFLPNLVLEDVRIDHTTFGAANLRQAQMVSCIISNSHFGLSELAYAKISKSVVKNSDFGYSRNYHMSLEFTKIVCSSFKSANMFTSSIKSCGFRDCNLSYTYL